MQFLSHLTTPLFRTALHSHPTKKTLVGSPSLWLREPFQLLGGSVACVKWPVKAQRHTSRLARISSVMNKIFLSCKVNNERSLPSLRVIDKRKAGQEIHFTFYLPLTAVRIASHMQLDIELSLGLTLLWAVWPNCCDTGMLYDFTDQTSAWFPVIWNLYIFVKSVLISACSVIYLYLLIDRCVALAPGPAVAPSRPRSPCFLPRGCCRRTSPGAAAAVGSSRGRNSVQQWWEGRRRSILRHHHSRAAEGRWSLTFVADNPKTRFPKVDVWQLVITISIQFEDPPEAQTDQLRASVHESHRSTQSVPLNFRCQEITPKWIRKHQCVQLNVKHVVKNWPKLQLQKCVLSSLSAAWDDQSPHNELLPVSTRPRSEKLQGSLV